MRWDTEVVPIVARPSVSGRRLVVIAAPLYRGRLLRSARRFLQRNRSTLGSTMVAVFAMGPRDATATAFARSRSQLERSLAKLSWLKPASTTVFGGVDPPKKNPRRDLRDWDVIDKWCEELLATMARATDEDSDLRRPRR